MTVEEFEERLAAWMISGAGSFRWMLASILAALRNEGILARATATGREVGPSDFVDVDDFLPPIMRREKRKTNAVDMSADNGAEQLARMLNIL